MTGIKAEMLTDAQRMVIKECRGEKETGEDVKSKAW